jgi:hypothetical protein
MVGGPHILHHLPSILIESDTRILERALDFMRLHGIDDRYEARVR